MPKSFLRNPLAVWADKKATAQNNGLGVYCVLCPKYCQTQRGMTEHLKREHLEELTQKEINNTVLKQITTMFQKIDGSDFKLRDMLENQSKRPVIVEGKNDIEGEGQPLVGMGKLSLRIRKRIKFGACLLRCRKNLRNRGGCGKGRWCAYFLCETGFYIPRCINCSFKPTTTLTTIFQLICGSINYHSSSS